MEDVADVLAPMKKQLVEYFVFDKFIEILFELFCKYVVEFVYYCQYLLKQVGMLRIQNGSYSSIKIIVVEVVREHLMVIED